MAKVNKNTLDEDADDLYINSIKAKLAILEWWWFKYVYIFK